MVFTGTDIKPDFHSHFSLVARENFRIGHAQSGETNRTERKTVFHSVLQNFLAAKPIRLLA